MLSHVGSARVCAARGVLRGLLPARHLVATAALMVSMLLLLIVDWLARGAFRPCMPCGRAGVGVRRRDADPAQPALHPVEADRALLAAEPRLPGQFLDRRAPARAAPPAAALGRTCSVRPAPVAAAQCAVGACFMRCSAASICVAFNASERTWVNFKLFGLTSLTFAFMPAQVAWLRGRSAPAPARRTAMSSPPVIAQLRAALERAAAPAHARDPR